MSTHITSTCLVIGLGIIPITASAQIAACATIVDDRARLACYDHIARPTAPPAQSPGTQSRESIAQAPSQPPASSEPATAFERQWELRPELRTGAFRPQSYRPLYALIHATTNINDSPSSPTRSTSVDDIRLDRAEAKLQLSFKAKVYEDLFGSSTDAWFGYTQVSYWQAGNGRYSSPFRETNYQPEGILIRPLGLAVGDVRIRYAGIAYVHESNGRSSVLSRSWNRLTGDVGIEYGPWSFNVRPWLRIDPSSGDKDDNPDIVDYVGRGELIATYRGRRQVITLTGRHSLRTGDRSRGSLRLDWSFPLTGALDAHVQMFTGYGESLIDYNHRQTTLGVGLSFFD